MFKLTQASAGRIALASCLFLVLPALGSCTAVSRGLGKLTANKYASEQSGTVWIVAPPNGLEPPAPADKTVYISYSNISDAELDLTQLLKDSAVEQGWTLVDDPTQAKFRLRARTRFFGEVAPDTGGSSIGNAMGAISGAAIGVGTYALVNSATDNWGVSVGAGAAVGGLAGIGISNASKPREWALINDFVLEEYREGGVTFEVVSDSGTAGSSGANTGNDRMGEGGTNTTSNSTSASIEKTSNYFPHGIRLSTWANQMNMKEGEAMGPILERTQKVVRQMLPQ